jgi:hypothetical protein
MFVGAALGGAASINIAGGANETATTVRRRDKFGQSSARRKSDERATLA